MTPEGAFKALHHDWPEVPEGRRRAWEDGYWYGKRAGEAALANALSRERKGKCREDALAAEIVHLHERIESAADDHRIADAARAWEQARDAWRRHCAECPDCNDDEAGAVSWCGIGTCLETDLGEAEAALIRALGGEGGADA